MQFGIHHLSRARAASLAASRHTVLPRPTTTFIIATNPRSGSYLLSEGLSATKHAGNPREWFNQAEQQRWRALWRLHHGSNLSDATYFRIVRARSTSANGIAGLKLHYFQLLGLDRVLRPGDAPSPPPEDRLQGLFPTARYIWLRRRDKLRQAISLQRAFDTSQWWSIGASPIARPKHEPVYDAQAIHTWQRVLVEHDAKWAAFFRRQDIEPLEIYYEDLAADYAGHIQNVLAWLNVPNAAALEIAPPRLQPQSDALNESWVERFCREHPHKAAPKPAHHDDPLLERAQGAPRTVPDLWKRWIVAERAAGRGEPEISTVLVQNGYEKSVAVAEAHAACTDAYALLAVRARRRVLMEAAASRARAQMARLDPRSSHIERRAGITEEDFLKGFYAANRPCVLTGLMQSWKAPTAWSPDYFRRVTGAPEVEYTVRPEAGASTGRLRPILLERRRIAFPELLDRLWTRGEVGNYGITPVNAFMRQEFAKPLFADFSAFEALLDPADLWQAHLLMLARGFTSTPLRSRRNRLHAQVVGAARHRLAPSTEHAQATTHEVVLATGEVLFIPVGWWHAIACDTPSVALALTNFLFPNSFSWR